MGSAAYSGGQEPSPMRSNGAAATGVAAEVALRSGAPSLAQLEPSPSANEMPATPSRRDRPSPLVSWLAVPGDPWLVETSHPANLFRIKKGRGTDRTRGRPTSGLMR